MNFLDLFLQPNQQLQPPATGQKIHLYHSHMYTIHSIILIDASRMTTRPWVHKFMNYKSTQYLGWPRIHVSSHKTRRNNLSACRGQSHIGSHRQIIMARKFWLEFGTESYPFLKKGLAIYTWKWNIHRLTISPMWTDRSQFFLGFEQLSTLN